VTTRRSSLAPAIDTSTDLVAVAPVMRPLSYTFVAPAKTWKTTDPALPTSSSTPTLALNRAQFAASA
jgi:hypothetical protein